MLEPKDAGSALAKQLDSLGTAGVCSDSEAVALSPEALLNACRLLRDGKVFPSRIRGWTLADARKIWQRWHWTACPSNEIPDRIAAEITLANIRLSEAPRVEVLTGQLTESERAKLIGMNGDLVYWDTTTVLPDVAERELLTAFRLQERSSTSLSCTTPEGLEGLRPLGRACNRPRGRTRPSWDRLEQ